ncbi:MAG: 2-isopropylmalate synthase [Gammaproteobacteria bacterium]|nr:2-isopropylmalate synthase [Gammaproteobacteria bacterium]
MPLSPDRVLIFDTTLRDGELAPGCGMTRPEKLRVARALADLGVDVIEAGFPAVSRGDWEAVEAVAREIHGPVICGLARCNRDDITLAARALRPAGKHRLHVFLATSAMHRGHEPGMTRDAILRTAVEGVKIAREFCGDVEFSPEDASRTEPDFLAQVVEAVIEAGATTINIPDTVGHAMPHEFAELFRYLFKNVRGIERVRLSVHCHDDLGMAVANSLMAVVAGARQIECTLNGIGERAGNCALEEVVMALKTRAAFFNARTGIDTTRLYPAARLLSSITGMVIPRNKAVVGENAFAHESGSDHSGLPQYSGRYGIMRPEDVGLARSSLALGKHSGRHALRERIRALGFELADAEFDHVFAEFEVLAERKKALFDGDIEALVLRAGSPGDGPWSLARLATTSTTGEPARATIVLAHADGRHVERSATGDGPVDAAFQAIEAATGIRSSLRKFELRSLSAGEDAQGEALVSVEHDGRSYRGSSVSTDIVESAVRAFLDVINRIDPAGRASAAGRDLGGTGAAAAAMPRPPSAALPQSAALAKETTP